MSARISEHRTFFKEVALLFLVNLNSEGLVDITWKLCDAGAGAELQTVALCTSFGSSMGLYAVNRGSAVDRAVFCDDLPVLDALCGLFAIEDVLTRIEGTSTSPVANGCNGA